MDGTVSGKFELNAEQPRGELNATQRDARALKGTLNELGRTMDSLGGESSTRGLRTYRSEIGSLRDDVIGTTEAIEDRWHSMERTVVDSVGTQIAAVRDLRREVNDLGHDRGRASVSVGGVDEAIAKIKVLEAELDELDRRRARAHVGVSGAGGSGSGGSRSPSTATESQTLTREFTAMRAWMRGHSTFWNNTPMGDVPGIGGTSSGGSGGYGGGIGRGLSSDLEDAGRAARSSTHDFSVFGLGVHELAIVAVAALPVIQSLGGAVVALGGSFAMAAEGLGAIGVAGGSSLLVGIGSIEAVAKPAIASLGEVWKAETSIEQARMGGTQTTLQHMQAVDQLTSSQQALSQSQFQARMAQEGLTTARREARRALQDLNLTTKEGTLNEAQAKIQLQQSQLTLSEAEISTPGASPKEEITLSSDRLAVQQAKLGIERSKVTQGRNREDLARARRQGVGGNPNVLQAQNALSNSVQQEAQARRALQEAEISLKAGGSSLLGAREALNKALAKAPPGTKALVADARAFRTEWRSATRGASADFTGLLDDAVKTGKQIMPTISRASNESMIALRHQGDDFLHYLASDSTRRWVESSERMFTSNLEGERKAAQNTATTLMHVSEAAAPFLHEMVIGLDHMTERWSTSTRDVGAFRERLRPLVNDARDWWHLMDAGTHLMGDLFRSSAPSGTSMVVTFTHTLERWDTWINENPAKVQTFFHNTVDSTEKLAGGVGQIVKGANELATALRPLLNDFSDLLSAAGNLGLLGSPVGLGGAYALYGRGRAALAGHAAGGTPAVGVPAGGGRGANPTATTAILGGSMLGGRGAARGRGVQLEGVSNVRTVSTVQQMADGTFVAGPVAIGRQIEDTGEGPFVGIAHGQTRGARVRSGLRGAASKIGTGLNAGVEAVAPYYLFSTGLEVAAGKNPFQSRNPLGSIAKTTAFGAATGATLGALGGPFAEISAPLGAGAGAIGGALAGAGGVLAHALGYRSGAEKAWEQLQSFSKEVKSLGGSLDQLNPSQMQKINEQAASLARNHHLDGFTLELDQFVAATGKSARALRGASEHMSGSFKAMRLAAKHSLGDIEGVVQTTAEGIKQELGSKSEQAKDALSLNFEGAAEAAKQRMHETGKWTSEGLAFVNKELGEALTVFGIKAPKNATAAQLKTVLDAAQHGDTGVGFNKAGGAIDLTPAARKAQGRASGGRLYGVGNKDTLPMADGGWGAPGELVLNHHTEADVDRDLALHGKPPLGWRVASEHRVHSQPPSRTRQYASGGQMGSWTFIPDAGTNFSYGKEPQIAGDLQKLAQLMHENIYGISGYRTPQHSVAVGGFANDPHTRGEAADIGVGSPTLESASQLNAAILARAGLWRPFYPASAHEINHVQLLGTGGGTGGGGAQQALPVNSSSTAPGQQLRYTGIKAKLPGVVGGISLAAGNAYGRAVVAHANKALAKSNTTTGGGGSLGSLAGVHGQGGSPAANEALGRRMMIAAGWPASEWPDLKALWTQESGWNAYAMNVPGDYNAAYGIPQSLGHGRPYALGDARGQIAWGLNYIKGRYGSPSAAEAHERAYNWYGTGGRMGAHPAQQFAGWFQHGGSFTTDRPTLFGAGERQPTGHQEHVSVRPGRKSVFANTAGRPSIKVDLHFGDVTVGDVSDLKKVVSDAAEQAAERLLVALEDGRGDDGGMW
jgi:hypothetical protein